MKKVLVTSGCSFTEDTWPKILSDKLNIPVINEGLSSQGNGLIRKRLMYQVTELLKEYHPSEILVGIVWSGFTRHELFLNTHISGINLNNTDHWVKNPIKFIKDKDSSGSWLILNHGWKNEYAKRFYQDFNLLSGVIQTLDNILLTQLFLKSVNVDYFMTTFTSETMPADLVNHPEAEWIYQLIDHKAFLPILGEFEYVNNITQDILAENWPPVWRHPTMEQHAQFVNEVVIPFITDKGYIN